MIYQPASVVVTGGVISSGAPRGPDRVDADLRLFEDGLCAGAREIGPISPELREAQTTLAGPQAACLTGDPERVRSYLLETREWLPSSEVLSWLARICERVGLCELAPRFESAL